MDRQEAQNLSRLVKLEFADDQLDQLASDLTGMTAFADRLNELCTDGVKPAHSVSPAACAFREDIVEPSMDRERILALAPEDDGYGFVIPRVIG